MKLAAGSAAVHERTRTRAQPHQLSAKLVILGTTLDEKTGERRRIVPRRGDLYVQSQQASGCRKGDQGCAQFMF